MWPFKRPRYRVLVLCTANVCRSPVAEALMRHHLGRLGLKRRILVSSGGTDVGAVGRTPDPRVIAIAAEIGASLRGIRAEQVTEQMLLSADEILVMEAVHRDTLMKRHPEHELPISLFDLDGSDIPDPYFGSREDVRRVVERIERIAGDRAQKLTVDLD